LGVVVDVVDVAAGAVVGAVVPGFAGLGGSVSGPLVPQPLKKTVITIAESAKWRRIGR
jgi:hypothetical protein